MKNKDDIYLVVRREKGWNVKESYVCGVYATLELADTAAAVFNQQWKDHGWDAVGSFEVQINTFHDQ